SGVSRRHVALIASAALEDAGIISLEEKEKVIDKSKVTRAMGELKKNFKGILKPKPNLLKVCILTDVRTELLKKRRKEVDFIAKTRLRNMYA
ncbi:hypothetical protein HHI36_018597, partial [Cryptolaemus montrouzieri]